MKYGLYLPNFGKETTAQALVDLAQEAEAYGWDGFYLWDHIHWSTPEAQVVDPWVALAAIAVKTERLRIGSTVTPIARRRPWKLARETVTLDHLSNGRFTLAVGLGDPAVEEFAHFGEPTDPRVRAEMLDEGLEVLDGLWRGKPFSYSGKHYQLSEGTFSPGTLQQPRIPVWVGGFWPNKRPFRRAARWDGVFPLVHDRFVSPEDIHDILAYIRPHRQAKTPFDMIVIGLTVADDPATAARKTAAAGATWWFEPLFGIVDSVEAMRVRICQGPPQH